jgi:hypothetical protein
VGRAGNILDRECGDAINTAGHQNLYGRSAPPSSVRPGLHRHEVQCVGFKQKGVRPTRPFLCDRCMNGSRMRSFQSGGSQSIQSKCVTAGLCWQELRIWVRKRIRDDSIKRDSKSGSVGDAIVLF